MVLLTTTGQLSGLSEGGGSPGSLYEFWGFRRELKVPRNVTALAPYEHAHTSTRAHGADCFRRPRDTLSLASPLRLNPVVMARGDRSDGLAPKEQSIGSPGMELDHAIGYSIISAGLCYHPNGTHMVYAAGGTVVICDFKDPHTQQILTGHDRMITCIALGKTGRCGTLLSIKCCFVVFHASPVPGSRSVDRE